MIDFKPSQVELQALLGDTMGRCEREIAALLMVRTLQVNGDTWSSVDALHIKTTVQADIEAKTEPVYSLHFAPIMPDFWDMVAHGYARFTERLAGGPIEFTDKGLEALRRWVQS